MSTNDTRTQSDHAVKQLEIQKMELLVKIREHELELQKINTDLVRHGIDIDTALNW